MMKILQCSDGSARLIEPLRALDEVFAYLRSQVGSEMRCFSILLEYEKSGGVAFYLDGAEIWCRIYPENHPDAPPITRQEKPC